MNTSNYTPTFLVRFVQFGLAIGMTLSLAFTSTGFAMGDVNWIFGLVLFFTFSLSSVAVALNRSESNVHNPLKKLAP